MKKLMSLVMAVILVLGVVGIPEIPVTYAEETIAETTGSESESELLWEYALYGDGIELTGYTGSAEDVYVPSKIEGKAVLKVGDNLFKDKTGINSVTLGAGIKVVGERAFENATDLVCILTTTDLVEIGANAFSGCSSFNSVILYNKVTSIGEGAFAGCNTLTIYCNKNSVAHTYAVNNNITYTILDPNAEPEIYTLDGVQYYIMNGEATAVSYNNSVPNLVIPASIEGYPVTAINTAFRNSRIKSIVLPYTIRTIDFEAFYFCSRLTDITILGNVKNIGEYAFYDCKNLINVKMPNVVGSIKKLAFNGCSSLVNIDIPDGVTSLERCAFASCTKLDNMTIPNSVTYIDEMVFYKCSGLKSIVLPDNMRQIPGWMLGECSSLTNVSIPESVTQIGDHAFYNCKSLTNISIPDSVLGIKDGAFGNCPMLKVKIPSSVKSMYVGSFPATTILLVEKNSYAHNFVVSKNLLYMVATNGEEPEFYTVDGVLYFIQNDEAIAISFNGSITDISIPEKVGGYPVTDIRTAFKQSGIKTMTLPNTIKIIGENAFWHCESLTNITIADGITSIGRGAFSYCYSLTSITIPNTVESIGYECFRGCANLISVKLPDSIISIDQFAFYDCIKLSDIVIPDSITNISSMTFYNCSRLKSAKLPDGVTSIGGYAFYNCKSLTDIVIPDSVTHIYNDAFTGCLIEKIKIPSSVILMGTTSFPDTTILLVEENSYAHNYAVDNNLLYFVITDGEEPELYAVDGVVYYITNNEAIAVSYDKKVTDIVIPESVAGYPVVDVKRIFRESNIKSIVLPASITSIDDYAFYNCSSLASITMSNAVTDIGEYAFYRCSYLSSITIPNSVTTIGDWAFAFCSRLANIKISNNIMNIGNAVFHSCTKLTSVEIPNGIKSIGSSMFQQCSNLAKVTISDSVTTIGQSAFLLCERLSDITIPSSVKRIESNAFSQCPIDRIKIPTSVTSMGADIFPTTTIMLVYENSYAHRYASNNKLLHFVIQKIENPEIAYGTTIAGTATYIDGTKVSGSAVEILYDDGTVKESVTTDENGAYEFTYAEVGKYTIKVTDTDGNTGNERVSVKRMNVFEVFVSGTTDVVIKKGYTVSGTITPESVGKITLTDKNGNIISSVETTDGTYEFSNIPNGDYILKAETENGITVKEITVFNGDVSGITLEIKAESATVYGYVEVEDREFKHHRRNWVHVTIYNSEGVAVDFKKSDSDGKYTFANLPIGEYSIVAEVSEMRPDKHHGYDRSHTLTGYLYINIEAAGTYEAETIVLYEENENKATISGKVTAHGENQACEVVLKNVFRHEVDKVETKNNGKYTFDNVRDGLYFITAVTQSDGMGFAVVVVRNGKVYGNTDITVYKDSHIKSREDSWKNDVPYCEDRNAALSHKDRIREEKEYYDGLSEKEKKQFSKEYIDRLFKLSEWISDYNYSSNDENIKIENGGSVISGDELGNGDKIELIINVEKSEAHQKNQDGIKDKNDYIQHSIEDTAGHRELAQYYDITLTKTVNGKEHKIENVARDTDTTGKLRITIPIPDEYKGHKKYSFVHVHNGETTILTDLDDNPDTMTFEIDRFSTFALAYSDEEASNGTALIEYSAETGKISVIADENASLYIATYAENGKLSALEVVDVFAGIGTEYAFGENQAAFVWNNSMIPLCEKFELTAE